MVIINVVYMFVSGISVKMFTAASTLFIFNLIWEKQFPFRIHDLNCSVTYIFCAMRIFKKVVHSKIDIFENFESAINLEI